MAYTLGNKYAKNLCKQIVLLQLIIENVVTCFFLEHSVHVISVDGALSQQQAYSQCKCIRSITYEWQNAPISQPAIIFLVFTLLPNFCRTMIWIARPMPSYDVSVRHVRVSCQNGYRYGHSCYGM